MQTQAFFMQDQVRDRVSDIMRDGQGSTPGSEVGGSIIAVVLVALTVLNVLAVAPSS